MSRTVSIHLFALALLFVPPGAAQVVESHECATTRGYERWYTFRDFQYFKPLVADHRTAASGARYYRDQAVRFSNSTTEEDHNFFDVSLGEHWPAIGYTFDSTPSDNCMEVRGVALFIEGAAHTLLDLDTPSSDVINTDFRVGGGLTVRPAAHVSLLARFFHESTHIGDEFTLGALPDPSFRRYNVSYEAYEALVAVDGYRPEQTNPLSAAYWRVYGGGLRYVDGLTNFDWNGEFPDFRSGEPPLRLHSLWEWRAGAELFLRCWRDDDHPSRVGERFLISLFKPQFLFAAADTRRANQYSTTSPEARQSTYAAVGVVFGDYFEGERTVRWTLDFYDGVQPHGQFRTDRVRYWAVKFAIDF